MNRRLLWCAAGAGAVALAAGAATSTPHHHAPTRLATSVIQPTTTTSTTSTTTTTTTEPPTTTTAAPPTTTPATAPPLPLVIGQWLAAGRPVDGRPAVFLTLVVPPGSTTPVGVAKLDTTRLQTVIYAGTTQPAGSWPHQGSIPPALQPHLEAAFNGGFQFRASQGGFYAQGTANPPLQPGAASLVTYTDGHADVAEWGRDATLTPDVTGVRQNLTLLVDNGAPTPQASNPYGWGTTLNRSTSTWRSAVGSDAHHDLFYVGGPALTPLQLAQTMAAAGAQRAMELDINPQWVLLATYSDAQPAGAALLPSMHYPPTHFFSPDWRDFVAVFEPGSTA